jgi:hypothetical protein
MLLSLILEISLKKTCDVQPAISENLCRVWSSTVNIYRNSVRAYGKDSNSTSVQTRYQNFFSRPERQKPTGQFYKSFSVCNYQFTLIDGVIKLDCL